MDLAQIEVILKIPTPKMKKEVRIFLGHSSYYWRFIKYFSKLESPLFKLLSKDVKFNWIDKCQFDFVDLNKLVYKAPILCDPY